MTTKPQIQGYHKITKGLGTPSKQLSENNACNIIYRCLGFTDTVPYSKQGKLILARDMNGMRLMGDGISPCILASSSNEVCVTGFHFSEQIFVYSSRSHEQYRKPEAERVKNACR